MRSMRASGAGLRTAPDALNRCRSQAALDRLRSCRPHHARMFWMMLFEHSWKVRPAGGVCLAAGAGAAGRAPPVADRASPGVMVTGPPGADPPRGGPEARPAAASCVGGVVAAAAPFSAVATSPSLGRRELARGPEGRAARSSQAAGSPVTGSAGVRCVCASALPETTIRTARTVFIATSIAARETSRVSALGIAAQEPAFQRSAIGEWQQGCPCDARGPILWGKGGLLPCCRWSARGKSPFSSASSCRSRRRCGGAATSATGGCNAARRPRGAVRLINFRAINFRCAPVAPHGSALLVPGLPAAARRRKGRSHPGESREL